MFKAKTVAIVTGASRGFGRAVTCSLARALSENEEGRASALVLVARSKEGLEETKNIVSKITGEIKVHVIVGDLGDLQNLPQLTTSLFNAIEPSKFSSAVLVNNAGTLGDITKMISSHSDVEKIHCYMGLNVTSPFYLMSRFLNAFHNSKLYVVNVSSKAAIEPNASLSLYCTGKAARDMLHQALAEESKDIRVLNYAPGPLDTEMFDDILKNSGSNETRKLFAYLKDSEKVLTVDESAERLIVILKQDRYKSGLHLDYFDELP